MRPWSVYLLQCADGTLYTGVAVDVSRRFAAHAAGRGARYTRGRGPLVLLAAWTVGDRPDALREELRVKKLTRAEKLALAAIRGVEAAPPAAADPADGPTDPTPT